MLLLEFYFAHPALFLIPIEHLGPTGMSDAFVSALKKHRGLSSAWIDTFNTAYRGYYQRAAALFQQAPANWFPPRAQNVCIVAQPQATRPYLQVFPQASWLLYQSDFQPPSLGSPEFAIYQFFHAERLGLSNTLVDAFAHNLGYFLPRSDQELSLFRQQAAAAQRPDADAFRALAKLLPQRNRIYHPSLRPPPDPLPEPCGRIDAADLIVARSLGSTLQTLAHSVNETSAKVMRGYLAAQREPRTTSTSATIAEAGQGLVSWLISAQPRVLLKVDGKTVWDPDTPTDTAATHRAIRDIGRTAAADLQRDLTLIDEHSRRFLATVREPDALPREAHFDQSGGVYIDEPRQLIVYDAQTNPNRQHLTPLHEATPPYQHWLLGARVMHEWGHLAVEAGWVAVPTSLRVKETQARQDVALLLRRLVREAPEPYRDIARQEQAQFGGESIEPGEAWMQYLFTRLPDYQTNLLARRLLSREELESYLRANVRCHAHDGIGPYQQLMRYAFEYQYLSLSAIENPLVYFLRSSWFEALFVAPGIITLERMQALWRAVSRVCQCQVIDETAFFEGHLQSGAAGAIG